MTLPSAPAGEHKKFGQPHPHRFLPSPTPRRSGHPAAPGSPQDTPRDPAVLTHGRAQGAPPAAASGSAGRTGCKHSAAGSGRPPRRVAERAAAAAAARAACRQHRASLCCSRPRHAPRSSRPAPGRARPARPQSDLRWGIPRSSI